MRRASAWPTALRLPPSAEWLPEFCQLPTVFATMLMAEIVVLVLALAPGSEVWQVLTLGTVLAQWIALTTVAILCLLRPRLLRLPAALAALGLAACVLLSSIGMGGLAYALARELSLVDPGVGTGRFVFGLSSTALLLTAVGLRYGYVHVQWRRRVQTQARVEIEALTARIRPHFLFNSMNTIAGLVRVDADLAEQVIEDLSDLFRAALAAGAESHPLGRELELCERYLAIEALRIGDRLQVVWEVDAAPLDLPLPPLLLQPLVENAVYHGIQPLPEGGVLRVSAEREDSGLAIRIENPRPPAGARRSGGHGMAQENVRQRLRIAYGERAWLEVIERAGYYAAVVHLPLASRESRP